MADCPWTLGDFFLFLALTFAAFLFILISFIIGISIFAATVEGAPDIEKIFRSPLVNLLVGVVLHGAVFSLLYLLTVVPRRSPLP